MSETVKRKEIKSEILTVRVKPSVKKRLEMIAEKEDRNLSYLVNKIVENNLKISA